MTQIMTIDEVFPKENIYPMLVNFQNGYLTDQFTAQECMTFINSANKRKTVAAVVDDLVYAGEEETEELWKTFIVARNRKTGKVRLIESGTAEVKPVLKTNKSTTQLTEANNLELSRKFGSKKQKQQMEQREKLKVNIETVTEQMQNVTQQLSKDELDMSAYNKSNADEFYIPPINRAAGTVEEVYDLNKILSEEQFEKIHSELEDKDYTVEMTPLVKNMVSKKSLPPKLIVLAVYASSLFQLYNTIVKEISKKTFVICPHSVTLNDIILKEFMSVTNGKRTRPGPYKDKSLCHAIVFLLLVNNLKIDLNLLCDTLKLTPKTASLKVRVTGATIVNSGNKKIVQLKLPLNNKPVYRRKSTKF